MTKFRFSGHETFACRYAWLPKAVTALKENARLFSDEEQAIVDLGIGKNMVRATRFWMQATDVVAPDDGGYVATNFGNQIFGEFGLDRYLEDRQTLWLLHWKLLMQNEPLFAWDFLINRWQQPTISREAAVDAFERESAKLDKKLSRVTLEQHFDVFLHTYIPTRGRKGNVLEDNLDCPLAELELIEKVVDKQADSGGGRHETVYAFRREAKPDISAETFIYCLFDYWINCLPHEKTLTFRQVAVEANSIGQVFKMPEWEVRERLDNLEADSSGLFKYDESAAQQKVICRIKLQDVSAERLLWDIYKPDFEFAPFQTGAEIKQQSLFAN